MATQRTRIAARRLVLVRAAGGARADQTRLVRLVHMSVRGTRQRNARRTSGGRDRGLRPRPVPPATSTQKQ